MNESILRPQLGHAPEYYKDGRWYKFIGANHKMMQEARLAAIKFSRTCKFPIGVIIVSEGKIITRSGNGNGYHETHLNAPGHHKGCIRSFISKEREKQGLPKLKSGEKFGVCPGCSTDAHAEARAIAETTNKSLLQGADMYIFGHYWCCADCWSKMINAGIRQVFLVKELIPDPGGPEKNDALRKWHEEFSQLSEFCKHINTK